MISSTRLLKRTTALACVAAMLSSAATLSAQVIRIKPEVNADPNQNVRLGDLATISGIDARTGESLLNLTVIPAISEARTLRAEAILMAVIAQVGPGSLADALQIEGAAACSIQFPTDAPKPVKKTISRPKSVSAKIASIDNSHPVPTSLAAVANAKNFAKADPKNTAPTLAKQVMARLQEDLAATPDDLRISFDTVNPLLDQQPPAGRRWVFRPLSRALLGTVQMEAQLMEGSRVVQKLNLQVQVLKRQRVLVAAAPVARGEVVTRSHFRTDDIWLDRSMPTLLLAEKDVIGLEAVRDVAAGSNLDQRDFKPVVMASRQDTVSVIFLHGNMKVQSKGKAVTEGKLHDTIQIKNETSSEVYEAVLIGKRLAVVGGPLTEAQEKQLREAR